MEDNTTVLAPEGATDTEGQNEIESLGDEWSGRGRTKSKREKTKQHLAKKFASELQQKNTVLLLIDDEKVKPIEVDLACKTYPKEHEAFTSAFIRQNEFARRIFTGGDRLLKWYFQEDHLTFPRLCLIYQNSRSGSGRTNPWVPKLIRNGPALRGPVVLVQQKKSPNAETVVFDQYKRDDRHMLPAAASFFHTSSCTDVPTRVAAVQRPTMRASAPPLSLKNQPVGRPSVPIMDDAVQPQHPYLSSSLSPPYTIATLSSMPGSPSSSSPSSSTSSSPSNTPPPSLPHSPRGSFTASMFVSSPAATTRAASAPTSFHTLPIMQSDSAVSLSGSHPSVPYSSAHFFSPAVANGQIQSDVHGYEQQPGMVERPSIGTTVSRPSEDFSAFSSPSAFSYSLWSYPSAAAAPASSSPAISHIARRQVAHPHHPQHSYSADGMLSISHNVPTQTHRQPLAQPLSLSTSGVYMPSHHQYRPSALASRATSRHFSWEGPLEKSARPLIVDTPSLAPAPVPIIRRASADDSGNRHGVDEQIVTQLKKIRDGPGPLKAKLESLTQAFEEYLRTHEMAHAEITATGAPKKRSGSGRAVAPTPSARVSQKTKLYCRTMIFEAKIARVSEKCAEDPRDKRSLAKWEDLMRSQARELLADGMMDRHLVDRILLACFIMRRVQTACDLVREIAKQVPAVMSQEEWDVLADRYEVFSPWLATIMHRTANTGQQTEMDARDTRVSLRILRRRTGPEGSGEEEIFRTVAPLSATVHELKNKLWQEQKTLVAFESDDQSHLLRPSDMGVSYRTWRGTEVYLQSSDVLQDYFLPPTSKSEASARVDEPDNERQSRSRRCRGTNAEQTLAYDIIVTREPRLMAFAHFPDLAGSLARLKSMVDNEEREQWGTIGTSSRDREGRRGISGSRVLLYDYLCHHFEYLEEQNACTVHQERKERRRLKERAVLHDERQRKDIENGYRDQMQGHKEKQMETGQRRASGHEVANGREGGYQDDFGSRPLRYIARFFAAANASEQRSTDWGRSGRAERCAFHLGSLTKEDEEPLYAVFSKNSAWPFRSHQRWVFLSWCDEFSLVEEHGLSSSTQAPSSSTSPRSVALPSPSRYFKNVEDLYLVPNVKIYFNAEHMLKSKINLKRFDQCAYTKDELAVVTNVSRRASLEHALSRCLRSIQNDPSLAIPQSRADASGVFHLEFLAPLYVRQSKISKPDLVVSMERRYDSDGRLSCYVATTLLTLSQAFANARHVKKIRQNWLASAWVDGPLAELKRFAHINGLLNAKRSKAKRSHTAQGAQEEADEEEEEDEFKGFEQEIEKWVSETEGEESEEDDTESSSSGQDSPTRSVSGSFMPVFSAPLHSSGSSTSDPTTEDSPQYLRSHLVQVGN